LRIGGGENVNRKRTLSIVLLLLLLFMSGCNQVTQTTVPATQHNYVGSANSDKYHKPSCRWAKNIKENNAVWFSTKEEAEQAGYTACKTCKP